MRAQLEMVKMLMVVVDKRATLDTVIDEFSAYTRPDSSDDIIVDCVFLDDEEVRKRFLEITELQEWQLENVDYVLLWR